MTAEQAEGIREFPELVRHDPFDRLLVAQASQLRLPLVTADRVLLELAPAPAGGQGSRLALVTVDATQ